MPVACGKCCEIDVSAEVGFAGTVEDAGAAMAAHRLQRCAVRAAARGRSRRSAPSRHRARGARRSRRRGHGRPREISACAPVGASGSSEAYGVESGRQRKAQRLAVGRQSDHALGPAARASSRTGAPAGHRRTRWRPAASGPAARRRGARARSASKPASAASLQRLQPFVDLDKMKIDRGMEARDAARGAQRIGHQGAAAGAQLDQSHRLRPAHRQPALGQPGAQKLAEHLGDFRRRREVAGGAHRQRRAVVAEAGMAERLGHEVGDRDRAGERDAPGDQPAELAGARIRCHGRAGRR